MSKISTIRIRSIDYGNDKIKYKVMEKGDSHINFVACIQYIATHSIALNMDKKTFLKNMGLTYDVIKEDLESESETNE